MDLEGTSGKASCSKGSSKSSNCYLEGSSGKGSAHCSRSRSPARKDTDAPVPDEPVLDPMQIPRCRCLCSCCATRKKQRCLRVPKDANHLMENQDCHHTPQLETGICVISWVSSSDPKTCSMLILSDNRWSQFERSLAYALGGYKIL